MNAMPRIGAAAMRGKRVLRIANGLKLSNF
jgi:hypothetical protein